MRRRTLPSLNALRTFEVVARLNSFTKAAVELNVTQGAASRMVRSLEEFFEMPLFHRRSRQIELTDEGRYLAELVTDALNQLEAGTAELLETRAGSGTLTIGMLPTFGTCWLVPRLSSFQEAHPDITVNLRTSDGPLDFAREKIDVAIRFGYGNWPDAVVEPIMSEELVVVCSPRTMDGPYPLIEYADLTRHKLIIHSTRPEAWDHWFLATDTDGSRMHLGLRLEHFYMVRQAAISGLGVALLPTFLVRDDIRIGNLIAPFPIRVGSPGGYYLITPNSKRTLRRVQLFRRWLLEHVSSSLDAE